MEATLNKGKAAGSLKSDVEKIWEEQVPTDWKEGHLIKIPKRGNLSKYESYSGVTLLSVPGKVFGNAVDAQLRDQQAGFLKDRLHYGSSSNSQTLWKPQQYGVPERIINITRNSYDGLQCEAVHGEQLTDAFQVRTGVRQGCLLSSFLFLLVVDWIMKTSTSEGKHGIQWAAQNQLDDLDFAHDLALLSHTQELIQIKTASVAAVSASVGLNIHKGKTKVLKFETENSNPITLDGETLEDVESITHLGSIVDEQGGSICKARVAFLQLKNIWNSKQLSTNIKVRIFNTNG
ncbi:uncharacterized protein DC041_0009825 [Schistosoma bovis]|uniref:DUF6451 domain-containing protein n=1 Tax=Schistosoma bovis TaxID=6184 RepID=A0A430QUA2_SCHBO|nr:uncharacterized protein DC041_0009825 [Schistosoma bovis]